jgi:hypothetical protein
MRGRLPGDAHRGSLGSQAHRLSTAGAAEIHSNIQQRNFNSRQAPTLYYTDLGPDPGYSLNTAAVCPLGGDAYMQWSYRAMLRGVF